MIEITEINKEGKEVVKKDYVNIIYKIAHRLYDGKGDIMSKIALEDLISEGMIALINAANKYDENRGEAQFTSYLYICVFNQMKLYLRKNSKVFPISQSDQKMLVKVFNDYNDGMEISDIAKKHNMTVDEVCELMDRNTFAYSLDYIVKDGNKGTEVKFHEAIADERESDYDPFSELLEYAIENTKGITDQEREDYKVHMGILGRKVIPVKKLYKNSGMTLVAYKARLEEVKKLIEEEIIKDKLLFFEK